MMNQTTIVGRILIVDDDPLNLQFVARTLAHAGFAVSTAVSGEQALPWIILAQYNAVVSEVRMPVARVF